VPAKYGIVDGLIYYANVDQLGIPTVHSLVPSVGQVGFIVGLFVTVWLIIVDKYVFHCSGMV
jgi:hypothetical protein